MLDSTLTSDRATPMLLLKHQSLYKWKSTLWCVCYKVARRGVFGRLVSHDLWKSTPMLLTWPSQFSVCGRLVSHDLWPNQLSEVSSLLVAS
jgi:hypothetical protein